TIVEEYSTKHPFIHLLDNPHKTVPYAMNIGIEEAIGDIIIRLDAHAEYPDNYFSVLSHKLIELDATNVGAICETLPINDTATAIGIASALSCSFGMGNSYFRTGATETKQVDTVPFGCFRKEIFKKVGFYDCELIRNQDDELNGRIIKNGGSIYLIPSIIVKYFARDKVSKVSKMFYQYGLYKPLVNKKLGSPATLRQFFPLLFVIGLLCGALFSLLSNYIFYLYIAIIGLYTLIGLYIGFKESIRCKKTSLILIMPIIFSAIHISYGVGYINGIFKILAQKPFNAESNR
ncbi:MAG: glycosyltransferase family 2 protein, partial [Muribaculaceae bacterium]